MLKPHHILQALLFTVSLLFASDLFGQNHCWIKYTYDAAGNRIERKWWCGDPHVADEDETKSMEQAAFGFMLAPNPARDNLVLTSEADMANASVSITSGDGRTVHNTRMNGGRMEFDISAYEAGQYILTLRSGQEEYQSRFTVVH